MAATPAPASQASLLLQKQLKDLCKNPVDGFSAGLVNEANIFEWSVTIIGPPDTLYEGGFFNAIMSFPEDYPCNPPVVRFTSEMWHPNVYADGKVCISILHPPGDDPNGYELATERWNPVHTVLMEKLALVSGPTPSFTRQWNQLFEKWACCKLKICDTDFGMSLTGDSCGCAILSNVQSIVLSIISMLSSPNDESPANVDAAKQWRESREEFRKRVGRCVRKSQEML